MTHSPFQWILSLNWLCQKWGQVQPDSDWRCRLWDRYSTESADYNSRRGPIDRANLTQLNSSGPLQGLHTLPVGREGVPTV